VSVTSALLITQAYLISLGIDVALPLRVLTTIAQRDVILKYSQTMWDAITLMKILHFINVAKDVWFVLLVNFNHIQVLMIVLVISVQ